MSRPQALLRLLPLLGLLGCAGPPGDPVAPRSPPAVTGGGGRATPAAEGGVAEGSDQHPTPPARDAAPIDAAGPAELPVDAGTAGETPPPAAALGQAGGDCPAGAVYGAPVPTAARATLVKGGFQFAEGPVWVASLQALFFTEFNEAGGPRGRIRRYTPSDGLVDVFVDMVGVNGLALDEHGNLVAASHDRQAITRFDVVTRARSEIAGGGSFEDKKFNSPNDVVVRADGNIYFTDPPYQRLPGTAGQGVNAIYRVKDGVASRHGAGPVPNGIGISTDGKWLYVTSSVTPPVRRFALAEDGSVGAATPFVNSISQGFAVDCAGNVYLTNNRGVRVFSPEGEPRGAIEGFPQELTNLAFGDPDRRTLYITARPGSLYKVRLEVPGFPN